MERRLGRLLLLRMSVAICRCCVCGWKWASEAEVSLLLVLVFDVMSPCSMRGRGTNDDQERGKEVGHDGMVVQRKRGGQAKEGGGY